jgi:hypothetical protein
MKYMITTRIGSSRRLQSWTGSGWSENFCMAKRYGCLEDLPAKMTHPEYGELLRDDGKKSYGFSTIFIHEIDV